MRSIAVLLLLLLPFAVFPSDIHVYFWNLDARELALGGSVGAREGDSWVIAGNPAAVPAGSRGKGMVRVLSFPNALRMTSLLIYELCSLPYDAISSDQRGEESKEHGKWLLFSLVSLYRYIHSGSSYTIVFQPMREYPARGGCTVFNNELSLNFSVLGLLRIGISGSWYYSCDAERWNPFELSSQDREIRHGFGGAAGLYLDFGRIFLGLDYRAQPASVFRTLDLRGVPVRDNSFAVSCFWRASRDFSFSLDLPNWNNSGRGDFLLPRAGAQWVYHRMPSGFGALQAGFFADGYGKPYLSCGTSIEGMLSGYRFRGSVAGVFGLKGGGSILSGSLDFFM